MKSNKKSKIQILGAHIHVSLNLHEKSGNSTWYRFLVNTPHSHTNNQTDTFSYYMYTDALKLDKIFTAVVVIYYNLLCSHLTWCTVSITYFVELNKAHCISDKMRKMNIILKTKKNFPDILQRSSAHHTLIFR